MGYHDLSNLNCTAGKKFLVTQVKLLGCRRGKQARATRAQEAADPSADLRDGVASVRRARLRGGYRGRGRPSGRLLRGDGLQLLPDQGGPLLRGDGVLRGATPGSRARARRGGVGVRGVPASG